MLTRCRSPITFFCQSRSRIWTQFRSEQKFKTIRRHGLGSFRWFQAARNRESESIVRWQNLNCPTFVENKSHSFKLHPAGQSSAINFSSLFICIGAYYLFGSTRPHGAVRTHFLSRLCGGQRIIDCWQSPVGFLSRLCGGQRVCRFLCE